MNWIEALTIIGTGFTVAGFIYTAIRNSRKDLSDKFEKIDSKWIATNERMDKRVAEINNRMDGVYHILLKRIGEEK